MCNDRVSFVHHIFNLVCVCVCCKGSKVEMHTLTYFQCCGKHKRKKCTARNYSDDLHIIRSIAWERTRSALNKAIHPWSYRYTFGVACNYYCDRNARSLRLCDPCTSLPVNEFYTDATARFGNYRADERRLRSLRNTHRDTCVTLSSVRADRPLPVSARFR